ncbi:MAG: MoaD family protein [Candidatus Bathyarchaeota archaeon]
MRYYAMLREAAGRKKEMIELPEKASVGDLMNLVVGKYGDDFYRYVYDGQKRVRDYLSFMLNGINVNSINGFETQLKDGDVLSVLPPVGGG